MAEDFEVLVKEARERNAERTAFDGEQVDIHLAAAMESIESGMRMKAWPIVAEGFCMLQDIQARIHKKAKSQT